MNAGNLQQIGERLRGERARLGLSQVAFSDACGVNRGTLATWEKGEQTPTAAVLAVMAGLGIDVLYIVTGRSAPQGGASLSPQEVALLDGYAQADEVGRAAMQAVADLAKRTSATTKSGNAVTIGGDVGQSVAGDQTANAPMTFSVGGKKK